MRERDELHSLSDDELLRRLSELLSRSRRVEADLVAHVAEVDARRLYAREAVPSMFAYATQVLHLSEHEAFLRITVARASRQHPLLLEMLRDGRLHLSGIAKLAPHLTAANRETLLARARHRTKREIEELVAEMAPRPEAAPVIRRIPERALESLAVPRPDRARVSSEEIPRRASPPRVDQSEGQPPQLGLDRPPSVQPTSATSGRATVTPVAPARYRVHFDASAELREKLERLQALMRGTVPDGDLAAIIEAAVSEKLERLAARRYGRTKRPRKSLTQTDPTPVSRHIPAAVRRAVDERDGGRCTYRDRHGRRCTERHALEYHHRFPFAAGSDHSAQGIALLCRLHNQLMADRDFGAVRMEQHRRARAPSARA